MHVPCRGALAALLLLPAVASRSRAALIGHWPLNEGSGAAAANAAAPGFPGNLTNFDLGTAWTPGPPGTSGALLCDGTDDIVLTNQPGPAGAAVRSFAAWIRYPAQSDAELDAIISFGSNATSARWTVRIGSTAGVDTARLRLEVSGGGIFGQTLLDDDRWHHVAVVQSGGTLGSVALYVDGTAETPGYNGSGAALAINTAAGAGLEIALGGSRHAANYNFRGGIADARLFDHALTAGEVAALAALAPSISSFTAQPPVIAAAGQPVTLTWQGGAPAGSVWSIAPAPGDVTALTSSGSGSVEVTPATTTTYTLTITSPASDASAQTTVTLNPVQALPVINEVMAANDGFLADENGDTPDWIELRNTNATPLDMAGYRLRDSGADWVFPAGVIIPPGGYLRVFASGKDRRMPGSNLHTDFSLSSDGEALELRAPGGVTVVDELPAGIVFPDNVSWGRVSDGATRGYLAQPTPGAANSGPGQPGPRIDNVRVGLVDADGRERRPFRPVRESGTVAGDSIDQFSGAQGRDGWTWGYTSATTLNYTAAAFVSYPGGEGAGAWSAASQNWNAANAQWGPSWERGLTTSPNCDLGRDYTLPSLTGGNCAVVRRWTSTFAGPAVLSGFFHHVPNAGDGTRWQVFVNGVPQVDGDGAAAGIQPTTVRTTLRRWAVGVTLAEGDLVDMVCDAGSTETSDASRGWFRVWRQPESFDAARHDAFLPVSVSLAATGGPVAGATLFYTFGFAPEQSLPMTGNGGTWSAAIPLSGVAAGDMIRWRIAASDTAGGSRLSPPYPSPTDSPRYHGTVAADRSEASRTRLGVLSMFMQNVAASETAGGTRASLFWNGRFYDNVDINLHSSNAYAKRSWDIDFNRGHRFRFAAGGAGHTDINLLTNWRDRAKLRNPQSYHMFRLAGHPSLPCETVRLELNGIFHSTIDLTGELNEGALADAGLDPDGALYKMQNLFNASPSHATTGVEKRTRKWETGNADLAALLAGLVTLGDADDNPDAAFISSPRFRFLADNVDLAATVNFIAAMFWSTSYDWGHKNYALYRDSDGTRRWFPVPWDLDLSWGHYYDAAAIANTYFDDVIRTRTNDGTIHNFSLNHNQMEFSPPNRNSLFAYLLEDPTARGMILRRLRQLADRHLLPAGPAPEIESRMQALTDRVDPPDVTESDADLDLRIWGFWNQHQTATNTYTPRSAREETGRILTEFVPARRGLIFRNDPPLGASYGGPVPPAASAAPDIAFGTFDASPATGNQDHEYIEIVNRSPEFVDLTGWRLVGGVSFTFPAGSVISPPGNARFDGRLIVAKSAGGWTTRETSPKAGEGRFVLMAYDGQLSSRGDSVELRDADGRLVAVLTVPPAPSDAQRFLRVTEVHYHPSDPSPAELSGSPLLSAGDFEFIEVVNTAAVPLDVSGCGFSNGIGFTFPAATVMAPGARMVVARNPAALALRSPGLPPASVLGPFTGGLDNAGERLTLRDAFGEQIISFVYDDQPAWPTEPDGQGPSLVLIAPTLDPDLPEHWRPSVGLHGNPGTSDAVPFTDPALADADSDGLSALVEHALGTSDNVPAAASALTFLPETGLLTLEHAAAADSAALAIETSSDLSSWSPETLTFAGRSVLPDGRLRSQWSASGGPPAVVRRYYRLRVSLRP